MKSVPRPLPVLPGNLCKLEISRLHHEDQDRSLGDLWEVECRSLEGVATGRFEPTYEHPRPYDPWQWWWSEAHERVYHLQSVSISFAPCYPHNPVGENGHGSPCSDIWAKLNKVSTVGPRGPTSESRHYWSSEAHTCLLGNTHFQTPYGFILYRESRKYLGSALLPRAFLGVLFTVGWPCHWSPWNLWNWAIMAGEVRATTWGTQDWKSELTFQSSISYTAPASSPPLYLLLRDRKNEDLGPNSLSLLSRQASDSVHT